MEGGVIIQHGVQACELTEACEEREVREARELVTVEKVEADVVRRETDMSSKLVRLGRLGRLGILTYTIY